MKLIKKIVCIIIVCSFIFPYNINLHSEEVQQYEILYLNSYHEGYKWSDDILKGIESAFLYENKNIDIIIEYMDTQRISDKDYISTLRSLYKYKFEDKHFDVIIASDDNAYNFLLEYGEEIFPDTAVVFCGVNFFEDYMLENHDMVTGIVEGYDIKSTIDLALKLHPKTKTIYYINDETVTGNSIMKEFIKTKTLFEEDINFVRLDGENLEDIENKSKNLEDDSLILFLIYFKDNSDNYFSYYESINRISKSSNVPIYGVWDFHLGYGIVGGMLTSGYYQGKTAGQIALRIIYGEKPKDIPILKEKTNHYEFDYSILKKFGIETKDLPSESIIINLESSKKKKVLILNSYNKGLKWTDDIEEGIISSLEDFENIEFIHEYMDFKRNTDPIYIQKYYDILVSKYKNKKFDLVITTDDAAFSFVSNYYNILFKYTPIIFSGVNFFEDSMIKNDNITGVVEAYSIKETIDMALNINNDIKKVIVINDITQTGKANKKNIEGIIPHYSDRLVFEFWENVNMSYIEENVKKLDNDTILLLMSFNKDKSNNTYSYEDSIKLIAENANVPIYSVWDFYLGNGLFGGMLTSGFAQGETAGNIANRILKGEKVSDIPVVKKSPNYYMFDYNKIKEFGVKISDLPECSKIINKPYSISDFFREYKMLIIIFSIIFLNLVIIIVALLIIINTKADAAKAIEIHATIDAMTGIYNRRTGMECLSNIIQKAKLDNNSFTICFIDVNGLKVINDTYGHNVGDDLIVTTSSFIRDRLREEDVFCRLGGDEFLIIFDEATIGEAEDIWENISNEIEVYNIESKKPYKISVSEGFAQFYPQSNQTMDELIEIADNAMYKNKVLKKANRK